MSAACYRIVLAQADDISRSEDGSPADLLILCQRFKYAVHEAVLAPKVDFIAKAVQVGMKVRQLVLGLWKSPALTGDVAQESESRTIDASAQDPFALLALINFACVRGVEMDDRTGLVDPSSVEEELPQSMPASKPSGLVR